MKHQFYKSKSFLTGRVTINFQKKASDRAAAGTGTFLLNNVRKAGGLIIFQSFLLILIRRPIELII
jgi:hypothetical protein